MVMEKYNKKEKKKLAKEYVKWSFLSVQNEKYACVCIYLYVCKHMYIWNMKPTVNSDYWGG